MRQLTSDWLDKRMAEMKEERTIRCPHCGEAFEEGEDYYDYISIHGEEGPQEAECGSCYKPFYVTEHVSRTYDCYKTLEEANQ